MATGGPSLVPRHCASRDTACESRRPVSSEAAQRVAPKAGAFPRRPRLRLLAMPAGGSWGVTGRAGLVPSPFRGRVARSFPWDRGPSPRWPSRTGKVAPSPHGPWSERPGRKSQPDPRREDGPSPGEGPASRAGLLRPPSSVWGQSLPGQGFLPRTHSRQGRGLARPPALHPGLLLAAGPAVALSAFPSGVTSLLLQGQPVCLGHRAYRHHGRLCPRGDAGRIFVLVTLLTNLGGTADVAKVTMATLAPSSGRCWPWPLAAPSFSPELARSAFLSPAHRKGGAE